jgi:(p)ppGpp synthase/HD superfamily hydrolase
MIYTALTKKALQMMFDAHKDQLDRAGAPYVFHPFHLAEQMPDEVSVAAALLHDVVEDSGITFDALAMQGISGEVIDILKLLTHDPAVPYMDYVQKIKDSGNPRAIQIKLADLNHNADASRLGEVTPEDLKRFQKYDAARRLLEG